MPIVKTQCKFCGEIINREQHRLKKDNFCSYLCANRSHAKSGKNNPNWNSKLIKCDWCKKQFKRCESQTGKHNFCSRQCVGNWMKINRVENKAGNWQGGKSYKNYRGLHKWVEKKLGKPNKCEFCGEEKLSGHKIHWANISGKYLLKITDWVRLCVYCHKQYDKGLILI